MEVSLSQEGCAVMALSGVRPLNEANRMPSACQYNIAVYWSMLTS